MIETQAQPQQQIGAYRRIYRPSGTWRAFLLLISLLLGGFSAVGIWYFGTGHEVDNTRTAVMLIGICAGFLLLSGFLIVWLFLGRVIIWPDRIEYHEVFRTLRLLRADILGRRLMHGGHGPPILVLIPRRSSLKKIRISQLFNFDTEFHEWINTLPNLDEDDRLESEQEIMENAELGITPQDRAGTLVRGKQLSTVLNIAALATCAWGWLYPEPYWAPILILALLPWIAVAITAGSDGLFRIDENRNDLHPNVALPFIFPGFVLMYRAISDFHLIQWKEPVYYSIAIAGVLSAAAVAADKSLRTRVGTAIVLSLLSLAYGFGSGMQANALLDRTPASIYKATITGKHISSGRQRSYNLHLAAWGPRSTSDEVSVERTLYDSVESGSVVCVVLHPGAMHVEWYTVQPCSELMPPASH